MFSLIILSTAAACVHAYTHSVLLSVAASALCYHMIRDWFTPLHRYAHATDSPALSVQMSNGTTRALHKRHGDLPPPYPNAWWRIMDTLDLPPPGDASYIQACGLHLAVFRSEVDGKLRVLDAYCPHLGANMGVGGKVNGSCITCPFHGWSFNGETGKCEDIPYSTARAIPDQASVNTYQVVEWHGQVYMWYDAGGRGPQWTLPVEKEIESGAFVYHGRTQEAVNVHVQEIPENGADLAHLSVLHEPSVVGGRSCGVSHGWSGEWRCGDAAAIDKHMAYGRVIQWLKVGSFAVPGTTVDVGVRQTGPGVVFLRFTTPVGRFIIIETITPIAPMLVYYNHRVFAQYHVPRPLAKALLIATVYQTEKDIPVWNHKRFKKTPLVVKGDGPILQYRRWYKQFYSSESITMEAATATKGEQLDW